MHGRGVRGIWGVHGLQGLRGKTATTRLLVLLAASATVFWTLAGDPFAWWDASGSAGTVLAASDARPIELTAARRDLSPPLRGLASSAASQTRASTRDVRPSDSRTRDQPLGRRPDPRSRHQNSAGKREPPLLPGLTVPELPGALLSFDGAIDLDNVASGHNGCGSRAAVAPSDAEGDVGPDHYVEWVNCVFEVFDNRGHSLFGPVDGNTLFAGLGGPCESQNHGDPIVLYDRQADRWLLSQFATPPGGPSHQCLAVSQTANPVGAYYRYDFVWPRNKLNDYAKLGVWPDGWYLTANQFDQALTSYLGVGVVAFNRATMLSGGPGTAIYVDMGAFAPASFGLLPSHLNGAALPPSGSPNYLVEVEGLLFDPSFRSDRLQVWKFHPDFANPGSSTLSGPTVLEIDRFDPLLCGPNPFEQFCVPQPGTETTVDALPDRLMYRNNYRRIGSRESLVFNQTVDGGADIAGIRWYEVRIDGGTPTLHQQGTFSPDSTYRWMGSANMDGAGNIAVGYSASSETVFPSLRYAARRPSDPLGTLGLGEGVLFAGTGSQTDPARWGDYSTLSVDPSDDCTFWYVNQYYATSSDFNWRTRIATFTLPGCSSAQDDASEVVSHDDKDKDDEPGSRTRIKTAEQRQARQRTDNSGLDDTHIAGNVLETHLDEAPPWIVLANRDGKVRVIMYQDAATIAVRIGQYFSGTGEKQHEQLFWAYDGGVE